MFLTKLQIFFFQDIRRGIIVGENIVQRRPLTQCHSRILYKHKVFYKFDPRFSAIVVC
jgi:hypothetical protein